MCYNGYQIAYKSRSNGTIVEQELNLAFNVGNQPIGVEEDVNATRVVGAFLISSPIISPDAPPSQ